MGRERLRTLAHLGVVFLRLGITSFGGPAAHIALMRDEFVRHRRWIDDEAYLDLIGAANLIPGPTSTEVAMHVGHRRAGWPGLVVAGVGFILPSVLIVGVLAAIYVAEGARPEIEGLLAGVAPVVVAIVAFAGASIGRTALRTPAAIVATLATIGLVAAGAPEGPVLIGAGLAMLGLRALGHRGQAAAPAVALTLDETTVTSGGRLARILAAAAVVGVTPAAIFLEFFKIGAVLFGSGYVLVALLRSELVVDLGWITEAQLIDAVAVGQATPGPLFSTATFIGYLLDGPVGATAATVGIFLPAFLASALSVSVLNRLRGSRRARAFLDGVNAAAVGLLAVVAVQLAVGTLVDPLALAVALGSFVLLWRGIGTVWLILAGAAIGLLRALLLAS
jgi:chromate transporter